MKTLFAAALMCMMIDTTGNPSQAKPDLRLEILQMSLRGPIVVRLINASPNRLRVWKESNIWGSGRWRVLILRKGRSITLYQEPDDVFTINAPSYDEIAPQATVRRILEVNGANWQKPHSFNSFAQGDTVIVIYDVPRVYPGGDQFTVEAAKMDAWHGVVTAVHVFSAAEAENSSNTKKR